MNGERELRLPTPPTRQFEIDVPIVTGAKINPHMTEVDRFARNDIMSTDTVAELQRCGAQLQLNRTEYIFLLRRALLNPPSCIGLLMEEGSSHSAYALAQAAHTDDAIEWGSQIATANDIAQAVRKAKGLSSQKRRRIVASMSSVGASAISAEIDGFRIGDIVTKGDDAIGAKTHQYFPGFITLMRQNDMYADPAIDPEDSTAPKPHFADTPLTSDNAVMRLTHERMLDMTSALISWGAYLPIRQVLEEDSFTWVRTLVETDPTLSEPDLRHCIRLFGTSVGKFRVFLDASANMVFDPNHPHHAAMIEALKTAQDDTSFDDIVLLLAGNKELLGEDKMHKHAQTLHAHLESNPDSGNEESLYTELMSILEGYVDLNTPHALDTTALESQDTHINMPPSNGPQYLYPAVDKLPDPQVPTGRKRKHRRLKGHHASQQRLPTPPHTTEQQPQQARVTPIDLDELSANLTGIPSDLAERILQRADHYLQTGVGLRKMLECDGIFRMKVGDYRILFDLNNKALQFRELIHRSDPGYRRYMQGRHE